jgi:hypothetical protein
MVSLSLKSRCDNMGNASPVFPYVVPCPLIWQFRHSSEKDRPPACSAKLGFNLLNEPLRLEDIAKIIAPPDTHLQLFVDRRYRRVRIGNDKLQGCLLLRF